MNNIETIDGIPGEWRTVTKASEVAVGQRVRYTDAIIIDSNDRRFVLSISDRVQTYDGKSKHIGTSDLFAWNQVQAFFPLADKPKRKVAKIYIVPYRGCITSPFTLRVSFSCWNVWVDHYCSRKSALRGAHRFCEAIGYECEVVK
jgi:hypothetical protein